MDNKSVKDNIYRLRKEKKFSQREVADKLGLSRNSYRGIEKGGTILVSSHLEEIAEALDTTIPVVLGYDQKDSGHSLADGAENPAINTLKKENENLRAEIKRLEGKLEEANNQIALLEELRTSQKEAISNRDESIARLKRQLGTSDEAEKLDNDGESE